MSAEFAIDLAAGAAAQIGGLAVIAIHRAFFYAFSQKRIHGFSRWRRIAGELIAEIGERELQTIGKLFRVGDGFGQVGEEALTSLARFSDAARN